MVLATSTPQDDPDPHPDRQDMVLEVDYPKQNRAIYIDPSLAGQILQFGFVNVATYYQGSGIFYDNVSFIHLDNQCDGDDESSDDEGCDDDSSDDDSSSDDDDIDADFL